MYTHSYEEADQNRELPSPLQYHHPLQDLPNQSVNTEISYIGPAREIIITPLSYGFHVKVGCQYFAIETVEKLVTNLKNYLNNPSEIENNWMKSDKKELL